MTIFTSGKIASVSDHVTLYGDPHNPDYFSTEPPLGYMTVTYKLERGIPIAQSRVVRMIATETIPEIGDKRKEGC